MLRVRIPPEPLKRRRYALAEQPGMLATLSRWRPWVQIPSGALSLFAIDRIKISCVGWASASPGGCKPPAFGYWRFNSVPTHSGCDLDIFQAGGCSIGPHKADFPVRVRGLGLFLRAGRRSAEPHKLGGWVRLPCPQLDEVQRPGRQTGKAAGMRCRCVWVRLPSRPLCELVRICVSQNVPWSNGKAPGLHPGDGGSIPSGMTVGLKKEAMGCWSNGKTPGLQPGDRGSTPRRSTRLKERKAAGYGSPGLFAKECAPTGMRVRIPRLPLAFRSVQEGLPDLETGPGWKPGER